MSTRTWQSSQIGISLLALAFVLYLVVEGRFLPSSMELLTFYGSIVLAALAAVAGVIPTKTA